MEQQDIDIINKEVKKQTFKNYIIENKKKIIFLFGFGLLVVILFYSYKSFKDETKKKIAIKYNSAIIKFESGDNSEVLNVMEEIILKKDKTYSPLALYFIIDNNLITTNEKINNYFDMIINDLNLDKNLKYLNVLKKAYYNSDYVDEQELLNLINPLIKNETPWTSHGQFLLGEYYLSKGEINKAINLFNKILENQNSNKQLKLEAQKRIQREISD